ncbi:MAG: VOC family protein [Bacteroidota bacterium]
MEKIKTFLMFEGRAEEAMNFYTSIIPNSAIADVTRYKANEAGPEGTIMKATFTLNGTEYMCIDSPGKHSFTFTASMSLYVTCETEQQIDQMFGQLSDGGNIMMPLAPYPFSKKFGWVADKFGVSWQLTL